MSSASNTTEPSTEQKSATLLDGKALAKQIEQSLSQRVATLKDKTGRTPSCLRHLCTYERQCLQAYRYGLNQGGAAIRDHHRAAQSKN